jgi:hypothetical protein
MSPHLRDETAILGFTFEIYHKQLKGLIRSFVNNLHIIITILYGTKNLKKMGEWIFR